MTGSGLSAGELGGVGLAAAGAAVIAVEIVRRLALRQNVLDLPNERSSHDTPTPRGGGIAVVAILMIGWGVWAGWGGATSAALAVGTLLVAGVSGIDDVRPLAARTRFAVQSLAVAALLTLSEPWQAIGLPGLGVLTAAGWGSVISGGLIVIWCVGLTNAYNFMDGIDGIAASQAIVTGGAWAVVGWALDMPVISLTGSLAAGASLGFLTHNWSPARIFMGDVGSASLGFVFAALPVIAATYLSADVASRLPVAGLLFVWPFAFDAVYTFVQRLRAGENVFEAHRSHLYQRMVIAGRTHRVVTALYVGNAVLTAACGALWLLAGSAVSAWVGFCMVPLVLLGTTRHVEKKRLPSVLQSSRPS